MGVCRNNERLCDARAEYCRRNGVISEAAGSWDVLQGDPASALGCLSESGSLREGAVLVVGSVQSGAQIAEELYESGRKVYLSVSKSGRVPRRYRGQDMNWWSDLLGAYERTADQLPSSRVRFAGKPHISGTKGGHTLNLHQFALEGVTLVGRVAKADGLRVRFTRDLHENLAKADQFEADITGQVDEYIRRNHLRVREEVLPRLTAGLSRAATDGSAGGGRRRETPRLWPRSVAFREWRGATWRW
jgi:hypothetical protein